MSKEKIFSPHLVVKRNKNYFYLFIPFIILISVSYIIYEAYFSGRKFKDHLGVLLINFTIVSAVLSIINFFVGSILIRSYKIIKEKKIKIMIIIFCVVFLLFFPYLLFKGLLLVESTFLTEKQLIVFFNGDNLSFITLVNIALNIFLNYIYSLKPLPSVKEFHFIERKKNKKILLESIIFFMADKNKIFIQTQEDYFQINSTLKVIEEKVNSSFIQINKKYIINLKYVHSFFADKTDGNKYKCILKINEDTEEIVIGRKWLDDFKKNYNENNK